MGQLFSQFDPQGPMLQVREGMTVYDSGDKRVGKVRSVYLGEGNETWRDTGAAAVTPSQVPDRDDSIIDDLGTTLGADDRLPEAARARLLRSGYIAIDAAGFFTGDRYATSDQIATVGEDKVVLTVPSDELIRG